MTQGRTAYANRFARLEKQVQTQLADTKRAANQTGVFTVQINAHACRDVITLRLHQNLFTDDHAGFQRTPIHAGDLRFVE